MKIYFFPIAMAVIANVLYHISQKYTPKTVNPILTLIFTYITALIISIIIYLLYPNKMDLFSDIKKLNWTSFALGIAIIGLEMGFLLAYRAGWNMSIGVITCNVIVTLLLIPIGLLLFREKTTLLNILGILLCIIGIYLISGK